MPDVVVCYDAVCRDSLIGAADRRYPKVTLYTDSYCSNDAFFATVGNCDGYSDGRAIGSYSWDC